MIVEAELLRDHVYQQGLFARWKLIDPFAPQRDREPQQENGLDKDYRKFQVRRNGARHPEIIRIRLSPFPKPNQRVNEEDRPPYKQRTHEPVTKLDDVIDLQAMR